MAAAERAVWSQFVDWDSIVEGQGGRSFEYVAYETMDSDDAAARLPEKDDIVATALTDSAISVTPFEYGRRVSVTSLLRFQSHIKTREATAKLVGNNMTDTVEKAIRRGILGGTNVFMPNNNVVRTGLDATNDLVSFAFLSQLVSLAQSMGIEPIGQEFVAVIHPALEPDIIGLTEVKGIGYNYPEPLYKGEMARLCGIRFIRSRFGKLYLGGGTPAQSATTLNGAVAAGATTVIVTSAAGLAAGDFITIGTLETAGAEQVQILAVAANTLTIKGAGNAAANFGLKGAHANLTPVIESPNAAAICLLGANSVKGIYGANTGKYGKSVIKENIDSLNRMLSLGWYWYGGIGIVPKYVLRGEVATRQSIFGSN